MAMTSGAVMFLLDAVLAALVWPVVLWLTLPSRFSPSHFEVSGIQASLLFPAVTLLLTYALGLYRRDAILETRKALRRLPVAVVLAAFASVAIGKLLPHLIAQWPEPADGTQLFSLSVITFVTSGIAARSLFLVLRRHRMVWPKILIVGAGARAWDLAWMLRHEGRNLSYSLTFLHDPSYGPLDPRLADDPTVTVAMASSCLLAQARRLGVGEIVVAPDEPDGVRLEDLLDCKADGIPVEQYLSFVEREIRRFDLKRMEIDWIVYSDGFQISAMDRALKRLLDLVVSLLILAVASPILLLSMAAVALDGGFPIFYRQTRVTAVGRHFEILKLRTMRRDAEANGAVWAACEDARITPVGKFLRQKRLDELPQLFNVLRGEMSLVGPRPERPEFVRHLAAELPLYHHRHMLKAGLTGWAQVNYPYGASVDDARSKLSYDLYYVKNYSILFDLIVLLQTLRVVLWPGGVR